MSSGEWGSQPAAEAPGGEESPGVFVHPTPKVFIKSFAKVNIRPNSSTYY
jgi:hypothetical protein